MTWAFNPKRKFLPISITGHKCELLCRYCMGKYLRGMVPATTPKALYDAIKHYYKRGVKGFLISGGFNRNGILPIEPFLGIIKDIKRELRDIIISAHSGFVDKELAIKLRESGVDIIDFEFSLSKVYIQYVKNLRSKSPSDVYRIYELLNKHGPPYIAPHIVINPLTEKHEPEAIFNELSCLADFHPYILVLLVYMPTPNTPSYYDGTPSINYVYEVFRCVRRLFKTVSLGCMRPRMGNYRFMIDRIALNLGFNRIVNPHRKLLKHIKKVVYSCCSVPAELLHLFI